MSIFADKNFLLNSSSAIELYENYAAKLPIIDYHCHLEAREIYEDISFSNLTELWLKYDHYKWRLMRAAGVDEEYITGNASDKDKFLKWCAVCGKAIGNPLYHWSNLELNRYFGIDLPINAENAVEIWYKSLDILKNGDFTSRSLIKKSNVKLICTTNDPIEDLAYHSALAADSNFDVKVLPTFRPDKIFDIASDSFIDYLFDLGNVSGVAIRDFDSLLRAVMSRIDFFGANGCVLADHGMTEIVFDSSYNNVDADKALKRRLNNFHVSDEELCAFKSRLMICLCNEYKARGWSVQLHFSCLRDNNTVLYNRIGVNAGCDSIAAGFNFLTPLSHMLDYLNTEKIMPRFIIYSLNPNDNALIDTLIGSFQENISENIVTNSPWQFSDMDSDTLSAAEITDEAEVTKLPRLIHGAAWWFNDSFDGIRSNLKTVAEQGYLPGSLGMLTDSRSFLSYTRHEYFRRILCDLIGDFVEKGMFPDDKKILQSIIEDICYNNAAALFNIR